MAEYLVSWHINVEAGSPQEAALKAHAIQRDLDSTANVFEVAERTSSVTTRTVAVDLEYEYKAIDAAMEKDKACDGYGQRNVEQALRLQRQHDDMQGVVNRRSQS